MLQFLAIPYSDACYIYYDVFFILDREIIIFSSRNPVTDKHNNSCDLDCSLDNMKTLKCAGFKHILGRQQISTLHDIWLLTTSYCYELIACYGRERIGRVMRHTVSHGSITNVLTAANYKPCFRRDSLILFPGHLVKILYLIQFPINDSIAIEDYWNC